MDELETMLKRAGITKAELARRLNLHQTTVCKWSGTPPGYARAYLDLLIAYNRIAP